MNKELIFLFKVIRAVLLKEDLPSEPDNISWLYIYEITKKHNIANIVAYAINSGEYNLEGELKAKFMKNMLQRVMISENQNLEIKKIFEQFEKNGILYLPLKGILLQELYPSRDMRHMADMDILINKEQKKKITDIMSSLGFEEKGESNHEYIFCKGTYLCVELHKYIVPTYNDDLYSYYGDGWKRAISHDDSLRYDLSIEDNYIFILSHLAKHYRDAGVGIKHIIDIWLYKNKYSIDEEYVEEQLNFLNLNEFYKNIIKLTECWFENENIDAVSEKMTMYILNSGTFGNIENQVSSKTIRDFMSKDIDKAVKNRYINLLFPPLTTLKPYYPILEKAGFLLPVIWGVRICNFVLFKRKRYQIHKKKAESIDLEKVYELKEHMKEIGLDIYHGRISK